MVYGESALGALLCTRCEEAVGRQEGERRGEGEGVLASGGAHHVFGFLCLLLLHLVRPHFRLPLLLSSGQLQSSQALPEEDTQQSSLEAHCVHGQHP